MKKSIATLALIFMSIGAMAQSTPHTITVNGSHAYHIGPEYSSKMVVSMNNVYYDAQTMGLGEIKSGYLDKLAKAGISSDRLTEDPLQYALLGYEKEGTILVFKTRSLDEMQKFLAVKAIGVTRSDTTLDMELTDAQMADYAQAAFVVATARARAIAAKIGRNVGKVVSLSDTNTKKITESLYYGNAQDTRDYFISVSFELL